MGYSGLRTFKQPMDEMDHQNFFNRNFATNYDKDDALPALKPVPLNDTELENKADRIEAELHAKAAIKVERGNKIELPETQHVLSEIINDDDDDWLRKDDVPIFELVKNRKEQDNMNCLILPNEDRDNKILINE
jgi:hypothetical protein